jgi:hypothetical protein
MFCNSSSIAFDTPSTRGIKAECRCENICVKCQMYNSYQGDYECMNCRKDLGDLSSLFKYQYTFEKYHYFGDYADLLINFKEKYPKEVERLFDKKEYDDLIENVLRCNNFDFLYDIIMENDPDECPTEEAYNEWVDNMDKKLKIDKYVISFKVQEKMEENERERL